MFNGSACREGSGSPIGLRYAVPRTWSSSTSVPARNPARAGRWSAGRRRKQTADGHVPSQGLVPKPLLLLSQEQPRPYRRWTPVENQSAQFGRCEGRTSSCCKIGTLVVGGEAISGVEHGEGEGPHVWFLFRNCLECVLYYALARVVGLWS